MAGQLLNGRPAPRPVEERIRNDGSSVWLTMVRFERQQTVMATKLASSREGLFSNDASSSVGFQAVRLTEGSLLTDPLTMELRFPQLVPLQDTAILMTFRLLSARVIL